MYSFQLFFFWFLFPNEAPRVTIFRLYEKNSTISSSRCFPRDCVASVGKFTIFLKHGLEINWIEKVKLRLKIIKFNTIFFFHRRFTIAVSSTFFLFLTSMWILYFLPIQSTAIFCFSGKSILMFSVFFFYRARKWS